MKTRHAARIVAMQIIFQADTLSDWTDTAYQRFFITFYNGTESPELDADTKSYCLSLVQLVAENIKAIDQRIVDLELSWSISRMARIDRAILRLALAESSLDLPVKVVIDEALKLAREYSGDQAVGFLNAALEKALEPQINKVPSIG